jgi:SAM-dependent methyltransferase
MTNSTERFSNRVENYIKYRPDYPREILTLFRDEMGVTEDSVIADVGSGTGISTRMLLENGNVVFGVEPNGPMRAAAENILKDFAKFTSIDGTATETNLPDASVDLVTAFQAFHWFDGDKTRDEFVRILKPGGYVALIWNERQVDTNEFLVEYEKFLLKYASDYTKVRHENTGPEELRRFFGKDFAVAEFQNAQNLDFDGLKGRVLSSSYMPAAGDDRYASMIEELRALFTKYEEKGRITLLYDTRVNFSQL